MPFQVVNLLDTEKRLPAEALEELLVSFSCKQNQHIENFFRSHSVSCAKQHFAITYLVLNTLGEVAGFFTLAHKPVFFEHNRLDGKRRRRVRQFCLHPIDASPANSQAPLLASAFLIAQLAKNSAPLQGEKVTGAQLLDFAKAVLEDIQKRIGGGLIFLECENQPKLLDFYQRNGFQKFGERASSAEGELYHQLLQVF